MRHLSVTSAAVVVVLMVGAAMAADAVKSGPQVGEDVPGAFNVLNVNGPQAGKSNCQI